MADEFRLWSFLGCDFYIVFSESSTTWGLSTVRNAARTLDKAVFEKFFKGWFGETAVMWVPGWLAG